MKPMPLAILMVLTFPATALAADPPKVPPAVPPRIAAPPPVYIPSPKPKSRLRKLDEQVGKIELSRDGETIFFAGTITTGSYRALASLLDANPRVKRLDIASMGGLVLAGRLMGSLVGRRKLAVHVEHVCASACTLVLAGSSERSMGPEARIGFHQSYDLVQPAKARADAANAADASPRAFDASDLGDRFSRSSLANAGVDAAFINRAMATRSDDMWYPDPAELLAANVVGAAAAAPRPADPAWALAREAVVKTLPAPLWSTLQTYDPLLWQRAIDAIWRERNAGGDEDSAVRSARTVVTDTLLLTLPRAPKPLVARLALLYGAQGRLAALDDYVICRVDPLEERVPTAAEQAQVVLEDAAFADLMRVERWEKLMSPKKAGKLFRAFLRDNWSLADALAAAEDDTPEARCRSGLQLLAAIGSLPSDRGGEVFRAMMTMEE